MWGSTSRDAVTRGGSSGGVGQSLEGGEEGRSVETQHCRTREELIVEIFLYTISAWNLSRDRAYHLSITNLCRGISDL
jgi:hypothetical protein